MHAREIIVLLELTLQLILLHVVKSDYPDFRAGAVHFDRFTSLVHHLRDLTRVGVALQCGGSRNRPVLSEN